MRTILTAIAILVATICAASAHAGLDRASPAVGGTVAQAPKEVVLWFTDKLEPAFSSITVQDEKGEPVHAGKAEVDRTTRTQIRVPLKALSPGTYKVMWRVLSVDTHRVEGTFTFRVAP
jgi:methionine-rich copper-binding protein CopC